MDIVQLLEYLQELVESAPKVPITGKAVIDKKEVLDVIDQIINYLPDEFKKAQWILGEKERILTEANKQYETVKKDTIELMKKQVENHDITKAALVKAEEIMANAQREAKIIRLGSRDYADEILCQLNDELESKVETMILDMRNQLEKFASSVVGDVKSSTNTIRENIKELRNIN
jgi:phosphopantetheine adenylyltransferase